MYGLKPVPFKLTHYWNFLPDKALQTVVTCDGGGG
jgi:hypothetical protein